MTQSEEQLEVLLARRLERLGGMFVILENSVGTGVSYVEIIQ